MHIVMLHRITLRERPASRRGEPSRASVGWIHHLRLVFENRILVGETKCPEEIEEVSGILARDAQPFRTITIEQPLFFFRERAVLFKPFLAIDRSRFDKPFAKSAPCDRQFDAFRRHHLFCDRVVLHVAQFCTPPFRWTALKSESAEQSGCTEDRYRVRLYQRAFCLLFLFHTSLL